MESARKLCSTLQQLSKIALMFRLLIAGSAIGIVADIHLDREA